MVYNELHYERINVEKSKQFLMDIITDFESAETAEKQIAAIKEVDNFSRDYMTYNAMASLNFSRNICLLYTSPSPRDGLLSRMPSSA